MWVPEVKNKYFSNWNRTGNQYDTRNMKSHNAISTRL